MKKQKEFKELNIEKDIKGVKMRLLGRGYGYFGLPKRTNKAVRLVFIWIALGSMGLFLISINQFWAGLISFACGLMFSLFSNLLKD